MRPSKTNRFRKALLLSVTAAAVMLCLLFVFEKLHITNFIHTDTAKPSPQLSPVDQAKLEETNSISKKTFIEEKTPEPSKPSQQDATIVVSAEQTGDNVIIFTQLHGYPAGECRIVIKNADKVYEKSAAIIYQPTFSICAGFSVPSKSLGSGTWNIALTARYQDITSTKTAAFEVHP